MYTAFILSLPRISQVSNYKIYPNTVKKHSILFSLWAIASAVVNPVTVWTRDNYKCCLHIAAAHLLLKHWCWEVYGARCEKGEFCPEWRGKHSIWLAFSPEWDHGISLEQPLGAAAVSADSALPHVAPLTNTASYWKIHRHTQTRTYWRTFYKQKIFRGIWIMLQLSAF